jgi:hypothetical protein
MAAFLMNNTTKWLEIVLKNSLIEVAGCGIKDIGCWHV